SLPSSTIAARRQRIVSGENGNGERHPVRLAERLAVAQDAVVARRGLDREPNGFEPADELANVLPHPGPAVAAGAAIACSRCATMPARQPGARPPLGRATESTSRPLRAISHEVSEFEFHISPVWSSSRPQTGVGI